MGRKALLIAIAVIFAAGLFSASAFAKVATSER